MKQKLFFLLIFFLTTNSFIIAQPLSPIIDSIPMRDGKKLAADIYIPSGGGQFPTILVQTPYNRIYYRWGLPLQTGINLDSSKYAFVIIDWRCFYGSQKACIAQPNRGQDGYDVVEWIAQQTWSDGKIGTWGPSALGKIQFQTMKENPPHLTCAVPLVAGSQFNYDEYYPGGVARTEYIEQLDNLGFGLSTFLYAHPFYDSTWSYTQTVNWYPSLIRVPTYMIGGWYDHNVKVMLDLFAGIRQSSPLNVRDKHRLLMGPWAHGGFGTAQVGTCTQGDLTYTEACHWSDSLALTFFDYHLRNITNGWNTSPFIQYFQMGENTWNSETSWPPPGTTKQKFYLKNGGGLDLIAPQNNSDSSVIIYDPRDPSPTYGGPTLRQDLKQGPWDISDTVETRSDILIFSTDALSTNIVIKGKPIVHLFVSTNRKDTDFSIRLTDVYPDGRSEIFSDGIKRMRFRNGYRTSDTASAIPNHIYEIVIDDYLPNTAITILPGHRLRVDVTSSNYPRFNNNINNGGTMYVAGDTLTATDYVYYDKIHSSYLELPVLLPANAENKSADDNKTEVFPNPAKNILNIKSGENISQIIIYDIAGSVIYKSYEKENNTKVDLSGFEKGMYFVKIVFGKEDNTIVRKIVVN
ncbi:MAG: CocE/NonD family hydrolase [Bacteroidales bacterium]|nr:CocE/NonD family hydrolase [Bacteroidales bacterium]